MDKRAVRDKAAKNPSFKKFLQSPRFLISYAKLSGCDKALPPAEYLERMMNGNEEFHYRRNIFKMNIQDIVYDKTRHGHAEIDIPFDANHGVVAVQDLGGCESPVPLRSVFVLENMNVPVCRFDPIMFTQSWILTLIRPKFRFKGLVACPKGDYGLARLIVEVGSARGQTVRSEKSVPFKNGCTERLGKFIPFEVDSPEYSFRPVHVFFFVCIFYVNREPMEHRGMRIANCTVQCLLPEMPESLEQVETTETFSSGYDSPPHACNFTVDNASDPDYVKQLKTDFFSCLENTRQLRAEEVARAEKDINRLLGSNLLEDTMDVEEDGDDEHKRKRESSIDNDGEPLSKKKC